ncbi:MAG: Do family serine endopeptidase [Paludibacteraceae bacterium]|jgi:Do/DeqQ family serine protease|nr:Do family serine endopeptidase [Paludibacteraceae bacterium]
MKSKVLRSVLLIVVVTVISVGTTLFTQRYVLRPATSETDKTNNNEVSSLYARFASVTQAGETDFTVAAELSVNAVVHVKTKVKAQKQSFSSDPFFEWFFGRPHFQEPNVPQQMASGSGVIISQDGYIVTNNHVIENSSEIEVVLNDKRTFKATLVGADPNTDIALLKIEATQLPVILFGNSDELKVGEWVLAVGNPFNLTSTVTAGIVSAKARNINIINAEMKIESFIQTDAAVNPGNSGGALVNTRGELVGINTAIASQTGSYAGYAFAVPTSIVQKVVADLKQYGTVQRAVLGVQIRDISAELAEENKLKTLDGAYVAGVVDMSAAAVAGIKEGDVIVQVNKVQVKSSSELQEQIGRYRPGDKVTMMVLRDDKTQTFEVTLKNRQGTTDVVSNVLDISELGAEFVSVPDKVKKSLGLSYGLQIKSLKKGKLQEAGILSSFVILKINNQPIRSKDELENIYNTAKNSGERGEKVLFIAGVYPNGKVAYYAIDLTE